MPRRRQPEPHFPVKLTLAQRRAVAKFAPNLADRLKLDEPNQRIVDLTLAELQAIQRKAKIAIRQADTGTKPRPLHHVLDATRQAISRSQESGWTNSQLHHFRVGEQLYGDPLLMQENFEEFGYEDSTRTKLSDILLKSGKRFRFQYEYDFGDSWHHEVLFEGVVRADRGQRYPLCLEGERACPPEDVGGVWGYADFVEAIQNPEHEEHEGMLEWVGGSFDPEALDPVRATRAMRKGLPDWRSERWM
jgi:hypothetical protein